MKKFTKLFSIIALVAVLLASLVFATACGENNGEDEWDGYTYTVYVYLADGTTPVENVRVAVCYNTQDSSLCLTPVRTDANGKVEISLEGIEYVGDPVLHFYSANDLPSGYTYPTNAQTIQMTGASYDHAFELTQEVTTLILAQA